MPINNSRVINKVIMIMMKIVISNSSNDATKKIAKCCSE